MPAGYRSAITRRLQLESLEPRWAPATITVTTLDAGSVVDGEVSLREAFHAANDNISVDGSVSGSPGVDIIEFAPGLTGVIQLQGVLQAEEPLLVVGNGRTSTILDGTSVPQASMIRTVSNAYLSISQMTLRDGDGLAQDGGAIRASSELYLVDVRITNSRAGNGGAISSTDRVWIENSTIEDNESNIRGGAIYTTGSVFIKDSIIRGNTGFEFGGAIYASGDIDIENSIIEDNSVIGRGGAIFSNAKITVEASEVSGNSATELGGAIFSGGFVHALDATFENNRANHGGAIFVTGNNTDIFHPEDKLRIEDSTLSGNTAAYAGGAIDFVAGRATISRSTLSGNTAGRGGGAIFATSPIGVFLRVDQSTLSQNRSRDGGAIFAIDMEINQSTLNNNTAERRGGAIYSENNALVINSTISNNRVNNPENIAFAGGGGIHAKSRLDLRHSTVQGNSITGGLGGGGIYVDEYAPDLFITGSIVAENSSNISGAPDIRLDDATPYIQFSFIGDNQGVNVGESFPSPDAQGNFVGGPNNGPIDPILGGLSDNGGRTRTHTLSLLSPAIDRGTMVTFPQIDQRGQFRSVDGNNDGVARMDMGAYEALSRPFITLFSVEARWVLQTKQFGTEDIVAYDPLLQTYEVYFDGSNVGLAEAKISALHLEEDGSLLLSFDTPTLVPGLGEIQNMDVVRFVPETLGTSTVGTFELVYDGQSFGLPPDANIDALARNEEAALLLSLAEPQSILGVGDVQSTDLLVHSASGLELYFDGGDVGLDGPSEGIDSLWTEPTTGALFIGTEGTFEVNNVSGTGQTVFGFVPEELFQNTQGSFYPFAPEFPELTVGTTSLQITTHPPLAAGVQGRVFVDSNRNGIRGSDESTLGGVAVHLLDAAGNQVDDATTDGDGNYVFADVPAGAYVLEFQLPMGHTFTASGQGNSEFFDSDVLSRGRTVQFQVVANEVVDWLDAGVFRNDVTRLPGPAIPWTTNGQGHSNALENDNDEPLDDTHIVDLLWQQY